LSGKSPICDGDLVEALTASFEPRFPASAVTASEDPAVRFLLDRGILSKGYESTVLCDRCERNCELPLETEGDQRFFVCPTGYIERPVPVPEDDVPVYQFDFSAFCQDFAKQNGLKSWADDGILGWSLYRVARGRRVNKRVAAIYTLRLGADEAAMMLPALKSRLQCDRLIVITPLLQNLDKAINALAVQDIGLVALDDLFARQTFDLDLAETEETALPSDSYCRVITHEGREFLKKHQYEELIEDRSTFDMFIDGFQKKVWKQLLNGKVVQDKLTPAELRILISYVEYGRVAKPTRLDSSIKVFETARRKADVTVGRYEWRAFTTHRTPADPRMKEYQFSPPSDLKFCIVIPLS